MELNFFDISNTKRSVEAKMALYPNVVARPQVSKDYLSYGFDYFDNPDLDGLGYGGYSYDRRYGAPVAHLCRHYGLTPGATVLEVGCAKGYVLIEFQKLGMAVAGIDVSSYAVSCAHPDVKPFLTVGDVRRLPFADKAFDLVIAKEILPHLPQQDVQSALQECKRVSRRFLFFEIQTGRTATELERTKNWDRTHQCIQPPAWWRAQFDQTGCSGDIHFKILLPDPEEEQKKCR